MRSPTTAHNSPSKLFGYRVLGDYTLGILQAKLLQKNAAPKAAPEKGKVEQEYTSERTSVNQLSKPFRKVEWPKGHVNLDFGGGKYDQAVEYVKSHGAENLVFDPYNRTPEHNKEVLQRLRKQKADSATCANVLNVIKEPEIRKQVLRKIKSLVKPGGNVYISVYRGEGTCPGPTCNGWQENRPLKTYLEEVLSVFQDASVKNGMIIATV